MKKYVLLTLMAVVCLSSLNAAELYDNFETYYDPGANTGKRDSHANPAVWSFSGNDNWSSVTNNGAAGNDYLRNTVGTATWRSSEIMTVSDDFGFNSEQGRSYSVDVLSHYQGTNDQPLSIFGVMGEGSSWYGADYALSVVFTSNYMAVWVRDSTSYNGWGSTRRLYTSNYAGVIDSIDIVLSDSTYDIVIDGHEGEQGLGLWNTTGALSGLHGFSESDMSNFDTASIFLATESRNSAISGLTTEWDNIASQPVPEPATLAVFSIGAIGLLRKRK